MIYLNTHFSATPHIAGSVTSSQGKVEGTHVPPKSSAQIGSVQHTSPGNIQSPGTMLEHVTSERGMQISDGLSPQESSQHVKPTGQKSGKMY